MQLVVIKMVVQVVKRQQEAAQASLVHRMNRQEDLGTRFFNEDLKNATGISTQIIPAHGAKAKINHPMKK